MHFLKMKILHQMGHGMKLKIGMLMTIIVVNGITTLLLKRKKIQILVLEPLMMVKKHILMNGFLK